MEANVNRRSAVGTVGPHDEVLEAGLTALDEALWRERAELTVLALRAKALQLVLAGDDRRWLDRAVADLESVARDVGAADERPARLMGAIVRHLGLPRDTTLRDLLPSTPPIWQGRLRAHVAGLDRLVSDIRSAERESRQLTLGGLSAVQAMLRAISGTADGVTTTYDQTGRAVASDAHRVEGRI